jgi:hypothetical protein
VTESQIEAISGVIADQIASWGADGVASSAIVWAILSARGAITRDMLPRLLRRLRTAEPTLRPDVDGLIDFLVAGRNLRQDGTAAAHGRDFERTLGDLAHYGSLDHAPSRLARILVDGRPKTDEVFRGDGWRAPKIDAGEFAALQADARTPLIVDRFVREVLPFSDTHYDAEIAPLAGRLASDLTSAFADALDTISNLGSPSRNIAPIIAGACADNPPDFEDTIERVARLEAETGIWFEGFAAEQRRAEEHEVDAVHADHIIDGNTRNSSYWRRVEHVKDTRFLLEPVDEQSA